MPLWNSSDSCDLDDLGLEHHLAFDHQLRRLQELLDGTQLARQPPHDDHAGMLFTTTLRPSAATIVFSAVVQVAPEVGIGIGLDAARRVLPDCRCSRRPVLAQAPAAGTAPWSRGPPLPAIELEVTRTSVAPWRRLAGS